MGNRPPDLPGLTDWQPLARGGFAMVWKARQTTLDRPVAVKIDERELAGERDRARFLREAGAAGRMSGHPGFVTVHDAGILADDRPYLVMELCPGGSLNRWRREQGTPSLQAVLEIGVRIGGALADAHALGVIHRDVKPANILIDARGRAGLADFGLAALHGPDGTHGPPGSQGETIDAVTPSYAAPEVLVGGPATAAADVYGLAATLFALLAGHPPRWDEPGVPTPQQIAARRGLPIKSVPGVPEPVMAVLRAGLADDPDERPAAAAFAEALAALSVGSKSGGVPGSTTPTAKRASANRATARRATARRATAEDAPEDPWEDPPARLRRAPLAVAVLAGVLLLVGAVVVAGLVRSGPTGSTGVPASRPGLGTSGPVTSGPVTSAPVGPASPGPMSSVPVDFADCSDRAGVPALCPVEPECWTGVFSYQDSPYQATSQDCERPHVYQTVAAVVLARAPRRQSDLDRQPAIRAVCTRAVANRLTVGVTITGAWEVMAIPPQFDDDVVYRCIIGRGTRSGAIESR